MRLTTVAFILFSVFWSVVGFAIEPPYSLHDKGKLSSLLEEAKVALEKDPNDILWLTTAGIAYHQLARLKQKGASEKAVQLLKKVVDALPNDAIALAYLGSSYAMLGRDSKFIVSKISQVNKGLSKLDKAVNMEPDNISVRIIRAKASLKLPNFFSRKQKVYEDFLLVVQAAKSGAKISSDRLAEIYYRLGMLSKEKNESKQARQFFANSIKASPKSSWSRKSKGEQ